MGIPPPRPVLGALTTTVRRDGLFRITLGSYVAAAIALTVFGWGGDSSTPSVPDVVCRIGMLLLVLASLLPGRESVTRDEERHFWHRMGLAYTCWLVGEVLFLSRDLLEARPQRSLQVVFYALFYVLMIRAIEGQPHSGSPPRRSGLDRLLTWPSVSFFVLGLVIYFVYIPLALDWEAALGRRDEFYFYTLLDLYLAVRFLLLARSASARRWRAIYAAQAMPWIVLVFWVDLSFLAGRAEFDWPLSAVPEGWWNLPFVFQVLANRLRHHPPAGAWPSADTETPVLKSDDELSFVVSARTLALGVTFPVLHIVVTRLELVVAPEHRSRPVLVFVWLIFFGLVALVRHRHLERSAQELWLDRVVFEEKLRSSEQDLRLMIERGHGREMLRASEKKFDFAFRSCPYTLVISSLEDSRFIEVNPAFEETFGYRRDEVLGKRFDELGLWLEATDLDRVGQRIAQEREVREVEIAFRHKYGAKRIALLSAAEIELDGERCLLSIVHDVTERSLAVRRLEAVAGLVENARAAIFEIDAGGVIRSWNRGAAKLFGWSAERALGKNVREMPGRGGTVTVEAWSTGIEGGEGSRLVIARATAPAASDESDRSDRSDGRF